MALSRRGFFGGAVAALAAVWSTVIGRGKRDCWEIKPINGIAPPIEGDIVLTDPDKVFAQRDDHLYLVVVGGSMPNQGQPSIEPAVGKVFSDEEMIGDPGTAVYEAANEDDLAISYPRLRRFEVRHEIQLGTLEELVEIYRRQLMAAAETLREADLRVAGEEGVARQQQRLRELKKAGRPWFGDGNGGAVILAWDIQGTVAAAKKKRNQYL